MNFLFLIKFKNIIKLMIMLLILHKKLYIIHQNFDPQIFNILYYIKNYNKLINYLIFKYQVLLLMRNNFQTYYPF